MQGPRPTTHMFLFLIVGACLALVALPARSLAQAAGGGAGDEDTQAISQYLPFDMPPYSELAKSPKKVFPHWHLYPISWDNQDPQADFYNTQMNVVKTDFNQPGRERPLPRPVIAGDDWRVQDMVTEIHRAQAIGADGFWMNHFGQDNVNINAMLEAARRVNSPFRVLLAQDAVRFGMREKFKIEPVGYYTALYGKLAQDPMVYRVDGKVALTGFGSHNVTPQEWGQIFANLKAQGIDVYFVPNFLGWRKHYERYLDMCEGFGDWGTAAYTAAQNYAEGAKVAHAHGKLWVMPIRPQEVRVKSQWFEESRGSESMRNFWQATIDSGGDWVQMVTWNDYGEATEFSPSTGIQYAYYDLSAYYIVWFKTGSPPPIVRDVLYYFHRTQFLGATPVQGKPIRARGPKGEDIIELLAFLKEPGTLKIEVGGKTYTKEAPAGVTSFMVPMAYGTPVFSVERGGKVAATVTSAFPILDKPVKVSDPLYHAGSSSRPPVPMTDNYLRFYQD